MREIINGILKELYEIKEICSDIENILKKAADDILIHDYSKIISETYTNVDVKLDGMKSSILSIISLTAGLKVDHDVISITHLEKSMNSYCDSLKMVQTLNERLQEINKAVNKVIRIAQILLVDYFNLPINKIVDVSSKKELSSITRSLRDTFKNLFNHAETILMNLNKVQPYIWINNEAKSGPFTNYLDEFIHLSLNVSQPHEYNCQAQSKDLIFLGIDSTERQNIYSEWEANMENPLFESVNNSNNQNKQFVSVNNSNNQNKPIILSDESLNISSIPSSEENITFKGKQFSEMDLSLSIDCIQMLNDYTQHNQGEEAPANSGTSPGRIIYSGKLTGSSDDEKEKSPFNKMKRRISFTSSSKEKSLSDDIEKENNFDRPPSQISKSTSKRDTNSLINKKKSKKSVTIDDKNKIDATKNTLSLVGLRDVCPDDMKDSKSPYFWATMDHYGVAVEGENENDSLASLGLFCYYRNKAPGRRTLKLHFGRCKYVQISVLENLIVKDIIEALHERLGFINAKYMEIWKNNTLLNSYHCVKDIDLNKTDILFLKYNKEFLDKVAEFNAKKKCWMRKGAELELNAIELNKRPKQSFATYGGAASTIEVLVHNRDLLPKFMMRGPKNLEPQTENNSSRYMPCSVSKTMKCLKTDVLETKTEITDTFFSTRQSINSKSIKKGFEMITQNLLKSNQSHNPNSEPTLLTRPDRQQLQQDEDSTRTIYQEMPVLEITVNNNCCRNSASGQSSSPRATGQLSNPNNTAAVGGEIKLEKNDAVVRKHRKVKSPKLSTFIQPEDIMPYYYENKKTEKKIIFSLDDLR